MSRFTRPILPFAALVMTLAMTMVTTACVKQINVTESKRAPRRVPFYTEGKFKYAPTVGASALFENLALDAPTSTFFGKRFDKKDLDAVVGASTVSTTEYARRMGVELYRVPRPIAFQTAMYFVNLEELPAEFDYLWNYEPSAGRGGFLVGLYFDACPHQGNCQPDRTVRPVILIDESSDRWTLVHEMMHHFFNVERKSRQEQEGPAIEAARLRQEEVVLDKQNAYRATSDLTRMIGLIEAYELYAELARQRLVNREFEEVAVEAQLLFEWKAKRFTNVHKDAVENAANYIRANRRAADEITQPLFEQLESLRTEAARRSWFVEIKRIEMMMASITTLRETTDRIEESAASIVAPLKDEQREMPLPYEKTSENEYLFAGQMTSEPIPGHAPIPCSHSSQGHDDWVKSTRSLNQKLNESLGR